jgi:proteasome lid subunit RPN8/RPN11
LASDGPDEPIRIPFLLWVRLVRELRQRGRGQGESGAFLLARADGPRHVVQFICYDDLDRAAYCRGAIEFHAPGYAALWRLCRERQMRVLADCHTHPGEDVRQSWIDMRNPMLPVIGHTAMVVPHFADIAWWSLRRVGVYEYLGEFKWRAHTAPPRVRLALW